MATAFIVGRVENGEFGLAISYSVVLIVTMLAVILLMQLLVGTRRLRRTDRARKRGLWADGKSMPKSEANAKAEDRLELVGLAGFGDRLPSELSAGQQQPVAVARAVVLEPEVLFLDEPLSNLDAKLRHHMREACHPEPPWHQRGG